MDRIEVLDEHETPVGWRFRVLISRGSGEASEHEVRLSWVDHDFWSGGASPAARVVRALVEYMLEMHGADELPERIDAATLRRRHPEIDQMLSTRL